MTLDRDRTVGKKDRLSCRRCDHPTWHVVIASADEYSYPEDESEALISGYETHYQIVQCLGCDEVSFCKRHWEQADQWEWVDVFPPRLAGRKPLRRIKLLPSQVGHIYRETHAALVSEQPILAAVGLRALVEAVCKEKKAGGVTLRDRIDDLVAKGILTSAGAAILHRTRFLGNRAAHEATPASKQVLSAAMDVVEHLLESVYLLERLAEILPKKE